MKKLLEEYRSKKQFLSEPCFSSARDPSIFSSYLNRYTSQNSDTSVTSCFSMQDVSPEVKEVD